MCRSVEKRQPVLLRKPPRNRGGTVTRVVHGGHGIVGHSPDVPPCGPHRVLAGGARLVATVPPHVGVCTIPVLHRTAPYRTVRYCTVPHRKLAIQLLHTPKAWMIGRNIFIANTQGNEGLRTILTIPNQIVAIYTIQTDEIIW